MVPPDAPFLAHLALLDGSTAALDRQLDGLTDADASAASLLPGWTRGHVLTHVARNADGMTNLVRWARTGVETSMYASLAAREADIEAGAHRGAAALVSDVRTSADRFRTELARLATDPEALARRVVFGPPRPDAPTTPASRLPGHRQTEVEVHHVDLGLGYRPADWPQDFAAATVRRRAGLRATPAGLAGITALRANEGGEWSLRPVTDDAGTPPGQGRALHGPVCWLAAWVMGRPVPEGSLTTSDGSAVPAAPAL